VIVRDLDISCLPTFVLGDKSWVSGSGRHANLLRWFFRNCRTYDRINKFKRGRNSKRELPLPSCIITSNSLMLRPLLSLFSCDRVRDLVTALGPAPPKAAGLPTPNRLCCFVAFFVCTDGSGAVVSRIPIFVSEALT
jgi:hypothetical protein